MKKGIIKITDEAYKNCWSAFYLIFKDFKPNHIEFRYWENDLWYFYGTSEFFDELKESEQVPFYIIEITTDVEPNGLKIYKYKFIKQ